jgi:hypothetical protein
VSNCTDTGSAYSFSLSNPTNLFLSNFVSTATGAVARYQYTAGTCRMIAKGISGSSGTVPALIKTSTGTISLSGAGDTFADLATLSPLEGDMVADGSSRTGSTGVAIYHSGGTGNGWKNLYTGATY